MRAAMSYSAECSRLLGFGAKASLTDAVGQTALLYVRREECARDESAPRVDAPCERR